jgi:hypothetical protein
MGIREFIVRLLRQYADALNAGAEDSMPRDRQLLAAYRTAAATTFEDGGDEHNVDVCTRVKRGLAHDLVVTEERNKLRAAFRRRDIRPHGSPCLGCGAKHVVSRKFTKGSPRCMRCLCNACGCLWIEATYADTDAAFAQ